MTRTLARRALIAGVLLALLLALLRLWPHAPLSETVGSSRAVYARGGELLRLTLAADEQYRLWVPLERISPTLIDAVLLYEDRRFHAHPGVNPAALVRSAWRIASGERRQGGSTLTMQLARRLYGIDSRTAGGKVAQIAAALWIEARHGKREILEAYLNTAPYGGNIEGVQAASLIYFRKDAARLSLPEALTLAVIPQNPVKRIAERGRNTELQAARERLWALWAERDPTARQHAPDAQLVLSAQSRGSLPFLAPHLTDMLLAQPRSDAGVAAPVEIRATIDLRMQSTLERVMAQYLRTHADVGMNNASALLLDASTMQVRALIGSADWHDDTIAGQVNSTQAKRSPGSTLKPFIYALALDQGLLHPKTMLKDAPTAFGPYAPENFDHRFAGPLSAQEALIRSRNVPAVAVAAKLSKPGLYDFMRLAGVQKLQSESHYGLALVLGGGEVTPEELAGLYGTLANGGIAQPLRYTEPAPDERPAQPLRLLSEEASFITLDMLRQTPRPDTTLPARPAIAWKTGTSWGFRDAWTAGVFGRHVLVVWVGNFDGSSNPALVGVDAAAPLFLRMVDALRAERLDPGEVAVTQPANLRQVEVCAATGGLPDAVPGAHAHLVHRRQVADPGQQPASRRVGRRDHGQGGLRSATERAPAGGRAVGQRHAPPVPPGRPAARQRARRRLRAEGCGRARGGPAHQLATARRAPHAARGQARAAGAARRSRGRHADSLLVRRRCVGRPRRARGRPRLDARYGRVGPALCAARGRRPGARGVA